jgi:hypothetical protein
VSFECSEDQTKRLCRVGLQRGIEGGVFMQLLKLQENRGAYVTPRKWQMGGPRARLACMRRMINLSKGDTGRRKPR